MDVKLVFTLLNDLLVNAERAKIGFDPLELFTIDVISSTDATVPFSNMHEKISSSYIREYISRMGQKE
jgi:phosphopantetheine adenylyltransferase